MPDKLIHCKTLFIQHPVLSCWLFVGPCGEYLISFLYSIWVVFGCPTELKEVTAGIFKREILEQFFSSTCNDTEVGNLDNPTTAFKSSMNVWEAAAHPEQWRLLEHRI